MDLVIRMALEADASAIAAVRNAAAEELTRLHGAGHWSSLCTAQSVVRGIRGSHVLVAGSATGLVATLRLTPKKPWVIDAVLFAFARRPLYLLDMAVDPTVQRRGIGRRLLEEAKRVARAWPAGAIRLDAYDAPAGAGSFYEKCGFRDVGRAVYRGLPLIYYEFAL